MSASVVLVIVHRAPPSSWLQFNHDLSFAQGLYHESFAVEDQCAGTSYYCSAFTSSSKGLPFRCSSTFCSGSYPEGRYTNGFEEAWGRDRPRAGRAGT